MEENFFSFFPVCFNILTVCCDKISVMENQLGVQNAFSSAISLILITMVMILSPMSYSYRNVPPFNLSLLCFSVLKIFLTLHIRTFTWFGKRTCCEDKI